MELRVLRYFLEAARLGNVSRAADNLCVTQPTVSRQLKELEEELGEKLFERTNYAIRLTPAGEGGGAGRKAFRAHELRDSAHTCGGTLAGACGGYPFDGGQDGARFQVAEGRRGGG